jgi:hypothetical protein
LTALNKTTYYRNEKLKQRLNVTKPLIRHTKLFLKLVQPIWSIKIVICKSRVKCLISSGHNIGTCEITLLIRVVWWWNFFSTLLVMIYSSCKNFITTRLLLAELFHMCRYYVLAILSTLPYMFFQFTNVCPMDQNYPILRYNSVSDKNKWCSQLM